MKIEAGPNSFPDAPVELQRRLTAAGGLNLYNEPNFRVVWGAARTEILGGDWPGVGVCYKRVARYGPRWVIELWTPPLAYGTPESWRRETVKHYGAAAIETLGPFPSRGEYAHLVTLEENGEFVQLTPHVCQSAVDLVMASRKLTGGRAEHKVAKANREEASWDNYAEDVLLDVNPAFSARPWVSGSYVNHHGNRGRISPH